MNRCPCRYSSTRLLETFCELWIKFRNNSIYILWNSVYLVEKESTFEQLKQCRLVTLTLAIATWRRMPFIVFEEWRKNNYARGGGKETHAGCWSCWRDRIQGSWSFSSPSAPQYLAKASYNHKDMQTPVGRPLLWVWERHCWVPSCAHF